MLLFNILFTFLFFFEIILCFLSHSFDFINFDIYSAFGKCLPLLALLVMNRLAAIIFFAIFYSLSLWFVCDILLLLPIESFLCRL